MSQYLQRLNIASVEEVGVDTTMPHYTQHVNVVEVVDSDGNPWEPVPGPDPWDELVVAEKALLHESNIYAIGETVFATTATYTGGDPDQTTYRWRWQWRQASDGSWANAPWSSYNNTLEQVSYTIPNHGQIRFQCQGSDASQDPVVRVSDFTSVKDVPQSNIGTVSATVNGTNYPLDGTSPVETLNGNTLTLATAITGDASPSYTWSVKQGSATLVGNGSSISATIDSAAPASVQNQCDIVDVNASDNPFSFRFFIVVGE